MRSESAAGASNAPPRPWSARKPISVASDHARPHSSELDREEREPRDEEPPAPEQVGEPAAEQQDVPPNMIA